MSGTETGLSSDEHLFQMTCLVSAKDIRLSAHSEIENRQLLALVMGSGDITIHYLSGELSQRPVMRWIPWFADSSKRITALCFDPSGSWLLVAGNDGSIFIIPALSLVDPKTMLDQQWSTTDLTYIPSPLLHANPSNSGDTNILHSHPTSIVWWQSLLECRHVAIMGTDSGDLIFVSLTTGLQVGVTFIRATISLLHICQDNSLDSVFLLITSDNRSQWKLLLEQRETGYGWPIDSSGSAVKVVTSNNKLASSSHTSVDLESGNKTGSYLPSTRSRLQGLKQLSVEKLTSLRQRLAETRSKGASAMAVNIHFRRESSGSSSDDTICSSSMAVKPAGAESSDSPAVHHVTTGPEPERLSLLGDTFMCPQFAKGRHLLSGYYAPTSIVSIHGMSLDVMPQFVHKLTQQCRDILVTDRFLYATDIDGKSLSVVSCQLSEIRIGVDSDYNLESVIERFEMEDSNERILSLYKRSCSNDHLRKPSAGVSSKQSVMAANKDFNPQIPFEKKSQGSCREKEKKSSSQAPFCLPKSVKELKLDMPSIDGCVMVTTNGVYEVNLRQSPVEVFMDLVLTHQAIEKAEKLASVFGLNLQQLLEVAGDLKLSAKEFPQAIALYRLSKCRHLKSVLKFAAAGHAVELLGYITLLFSTAGIDLTTSERIHLSNLAVMSHTEQVLRATAGRVKLLKKFLKFLRENLYYDEVLAVNVAGQTGLWEVLQFLASVRGLHPEVLDILTKIVKPLGEGLVKANTMATSIHLPALDSGLWLCISDPSLLQSLLSKPQHARIHLQFIHTWLPHLEQFALQRLAALYDPSLPQMRPCMKRMFKMGRRRQHSSGSYSSYFTQTDSVDLLDSVDEVFVPSEDIVQTFLLILLYLAKKCQVSSYVYIPELMEKIQLANDDDDDDAETSEDLYPSLPLHVTSLSAGFSHVALIRNGAIYTWGNVAQGCLGTGPTMSRYSCPQQIGMLPSLKVEVISVSCGRQHTLSLTNNGVYAWGASQYGQLGIGKTGQSPYPRLVEHLSRERIIAVSAGQYHSIALADDGRVYTWGWGVHGQLGHHSVEDCHTPTLVVRLIGRVVTQICGGHGHTVCLTAEGHVYTFGSSVFGQLGNGNNVKSSVPVQVTALTERIIIIATNYFHNLAVSSSNKLYMWGSSPQVLRLQAQAQKKARLLQQQHLTSSVAPLSPSKPVTPQVQSTLGFNSDISSPPLQSPTSTSETTPVHVMQQESSPRYHDSMRINSLKEELPNLNVKLVLNSYDSDLPSSVQSSVNLKYDVCSHFVVPSCLPSNNTNSLDSTSSLPKSNLNSVKCHKISAESNNSASEVDNKGCVNNQKWSIQNSHEIPVPDHERMCEEQVTEISNSEIYVQKSQSCFLGSEVKQEVLQSSFKTDKSSWNKKGLQLSPRLSQDSSESNTQSVSSSVFSDFESANMDTSSRDVHPPGSLFASRRIDENVNLKVKPSFPPLTATTAEGYSIASLIVSPTVEFKVLTAGPPPLDNSFASPDAESNNQSSRSESVDERQSHLTPQLVDTSLVVGRIVQVSCGCHHSALVTNEGVLYMWGRNLDGQLGSGTRKEIPIPTPPSAAASATASTKTSSISKSASISGVLSGGENLRFKQVSCGFDFTVAQENGSAGKIWAWGSNSQAQLGRVPLEESKGLEGKLVMLKTTKRVVKLPHGSQNSSDVPRTVPGLPNSTISFKYDNLSGVGGYGSYLMRTSADFCPPLCSIEEPCYGLRTLHYALQHFHGYYDSTYLMNKCLALENYQGAAKLAALDRHYHLALAYQLKALALATLECGSNPEDHLENQGTDFSKKPDEKLYSSSRNFTQISDSAVNINEFAHYSSEDKMRSTCYTHKPDVVNTAENKTSNPMLVNDKEEFKVHVSDMNSSCVSAEQLGVDSNVENGSANNKTRVTENTVTDNNLVGKTSVNTEADVNVSRKNEAICHCNEGKDDSTVNKMRKNSLVSSTADLKENILNIEDPAVVTEVPENSKCKSKIGTESKTETQSICKDEDRSLRNFKIDLLCSSEIKSEANKVIKHSETPEGKPEVEFSSEIYLHINEDLKTNLKYILVQSNIDEVQLAFNEQEDLKFEDSKQETDLVKPPDHISIRNQVNTAEVETGSSVSTPESLTLSNVHDSEMHAFAVQGGTEQMSEGHHLTSLDCSTSLVSAEQVLLSPESILPQGSEQAVNEEPGVVIPEPFLPQVNEQVVSEMQGLMSPEPVGPETVEQIVSEDQSSEPTPLQVNDSAVREEQDLVSSEPAALRVNDSAVREEHGLVRPKPILPKVSEWVLSEEQGLVIPEPAVSQAEEQNFQNAGMDLVSMNVYGYGNFQNSFLVSSEGDKCNSDKHETEMINKLTPILSSDASSMSESSSMVIKQEKVCENSGLSTCCFNDVAELQRNSDADITAVKNNIVSVANESREDGNVSNEDREMKNEADNVSHEWQKCKQLCGQENTSVTKSLTSDTLNGTIDTIYSQSKVFVSCDPNKMCLDSDGSSQVIRSGCNKLHQRVNLSLKSPISEVSDMLQVNNCDTEEKLSTSIKNTSVSLNTGLQASSLSTEDHAVKRTNSITAIGGEGTIEIPEISVEGQQNYTKQPSSDRIDLDNYENELKMSSGDKDFHLTMDAVHIQSADTVADEVCDSKFTGNVVSTETDLISVNEVSDTASRTQQVYKVDESNTSDHVTESHMCKNLVSRAAAVVEYYVSVMEEDSHAMMSRLLQQGFEFWLSHSLPVDHLENLLLKHMSKFFYPLGLLLFCKTGNTGEEDVETQQQAVSMLNHLSTRFCLQLCSNLLNHIDQNKAYPEYIELLAQVTSVQTSPGLNGCCLTTQGPSQSPEQLMEAILEGLGATKGLGVSLGQTCITVQEEVSEACKDLSSETTKLEQLLTFSCGHHYGQSVFHQSVLPELELGLLQLHHPLPNTARVLKGLFCSNSPNLHLACPRCVLSYLQSQTTPPL